MYTTIFYLRNPYFVINGYIFFATLFFYVNFQFLPLFYNFAIDIALIVEIRPISVGKFS